MSVCASNWAWGLQCVSGTTKLVLMALAHYADHEGICWPSNEAISAKAVASSATVRRAIKSLEEHGLILREERTRADGSQTSNVYYLQIGSDGRSGSEAVELESKADYERNQDKPERATGENIVDISRPAQNDIPPAQNERPPYQGCEGRGAQVIALEQPIKKSTPLPPNGHQAIAAKAVAPKGRKSRRRKKPTETPASPDHQRVFVVQFSPQWEAWRKHSGKAFPTTNYEDPKTGRYKTGWWFPSLWPPGCAETS